MSTASGRLSTLARMDDATKGRLLRAWNAGVSVPDLQARFKICPQTIHAVVLEKGGQLRTPGGKGSIRFLGL